MPRLKGTGFRDPQLFPYCGIMCDDVKKVRKQLLTTHINAS
jgi:hypothetical protein